MRLHRLEITAFGPFADTVVVDFDALSEAGLFLLSGATGAGKTSVLDAVCFALYGDVPGDRGSAKRLRSDQAEPSVRPVVSLEATLAGRRFRIIRSPSWSRPKKRGSGTTVQQASVTVSELREGDWVPLSSRLDEAGHLISGLVGMNLTQFTQVAMLPQGRFQAFLRARSEDRQRLLQQLFRTGRFAQVELWLRERRSLLRTEAEAANRTVAEVVSRISESAEAPLPEAWDIHDLTLPARGTELTEWLNRLRDDAQREGIVAVAAHRETAAAEAEARQALEAARTAHEQRVRFDAARAEREGLLARADGQRQSLRTLEAARRALGVAPLHRVAAEARRRRESASRQAEVAVAKLPVEPPQLADLVRERTDAAARVRALLPRAGRLAELSDAAACLVTDRATATAALADLDARLGQTPDRIDRLRARLGAAEAARAGAEASALRLAAVDERARACLEAREVAATLETARADRQVARETAHAVREQWLSVREARLDGMAAEIAGALVVGGSCPVCGSAEHPAKARSAPGAPNDAEEKAALRAVDDAKSAEHLADVEVRGLEARLARLEEVVGDADADALAAERTVLAVEAQRLAGLVEGVDALTAELTAAQRTQQTDVEARQRLTVRVAEIGRSLEAGAEERERLAGEIDLELAGTEHGFSRRPARRAPARGGGKPGGTVRSRGARGRRARPARGRSRPRCRIPGRRLRGRPVGYRRAPGAGPDGTVGRDHRRLRHAVGDARRDPGRTRRGRRDRPPAARRSRVCARRQSSSGSVRPRRASAWPQRGSPGWASWPRTSTPRWGAGDRCATNSTRPSGSPPSSRARRPTIDSRCGCRRTSSPTGSPRSSPRPTPGWPG